MPKESYTPSERRFEISKDQFSRERIKKLMEVYRGLQEEFPGMHFAFSLFGSLSKGRELTTENVADTDVDLFCFYDSDDLYESKGKLLQTDPRFAKVFKKFQDMIFRLLSKVYFSPEEGITWENYNLRCTLEEIIATYLREKTGESSNNIFPVSFTGKDSILYAVRSFTEGGSLR